MPEIFAPEHEEKDVYDYGFNKQLYKPTEEIKLGNNVFYNSTFQPINPSQILSGQLPSTVEGVLNEKVLFSDGSAGDVVVASNLSLTADAHYNNLVINNNIILSTDGYKIFVKNRLENNGIIQNNGSNASGNAGGAGAPGKTLRGGANGSGNSLGGNGSGGGGGGVVYIAAREIMNNGTIRANGGNGSNGAAAAETRNGDVGSPMSSSKGGNGGNGGDTAAPDPGGAGGTATATEQNFKNYFIASLSYDPVLNVGIGGGAGGGEGAERVSTNSSGGGGGGGGGHVLIYYKTATWGTEQANGGTAGDPFGDANAGTAGSSGTITKIQI